MSEPVTATPPDELYRVARSRGLLDFSSISPVDAALARAGNRFDVVGGGVLYAGTSVEACYAETLARFRPTPRIRELLKDEKGFMVAGGVPQDWRLQRAIGTLALDDPLPFLDVEHQATQAYLSNELASELVGLGYVDPLDLAAVCNQDRRLSRAIARFAYTAVEDDGTPLYSGIRYISRIATDWECWAIFQDTHVRLVEQRSIELHDPDLRKIAKLWDLSPF
jgi:hypothetical protein